MKKILILCGSNPDTDPRPNRMINSLRGEYSVTVIGSQPVHLAGIQSFGLHEETSRNRRAGDTGPVQNGPLAGLADRLSNSRHQLRRIIRKAKKLILLLGRQYEQVTWLFSGNAVELQKSLASQGFDLIISHDLSLLPLAFSISQGKSKILFDAREYYPRHFEDRWTWRIQSKSLNEHLCSSYLPRCDKVITVSDGLANGYEQEYGIRPRVVMSLPIYHELSPTAPKGDVVRIIHHGHAFPSRKTELMIEMMEYVDERFSLDLMLLVGQGPYWRKITALAAKRKNVRIIPPVPMADIIPFSNAYDIGLFLCPPTNFNLTYALPNKFFEFIMARLAVAIGPSIEMKKIVEQYDCGIIAGDFKPASLAAELNRLDAEKIMYYKRRSHEAAKELNADHNRRLILEMVASLLGDK